MSGGSLHRNRRNESSDGQLVSEARAAPRRGEDKVATGDDADTTHTQGEVGHRRGDDEGVDDGGDDVRAQTDAATLYLEV